MENIKNCIMRNFVIFNRWKLRIITFMTSSITLSRGAEGKGEMKDVAIQSFK
jgi:hypothetical protein